MSSSNRKRSRTPKSNPHRDPHRDPDTDPDRDPDRDPGRDPDKDPESKRSRRDDSVYRCPYDSRNGFSPLVWGPAVWHYLYTVAFNYPPQSHMITGQKKEETANLITLVGKSLPCSHCRNNFERHLKNAFYKASGKVNSKCLSNRKQLSQLIYRLHSMVARDSRASHEKGLCARPGDITMNFPTYEAVEASYNKLRVGSQPRYRMQITMSKVDTNQNRAAKSAAKPAARPADNRDGGLGFVSFKFS